MAFMTAIASIFAGGIEERAFDEAVRSLRASKAEALKEAANIRARFAPFLKFAQELGGAASGAFGEAIGPAVQSLVDQTGPGLSEADIFDFTQAQELLSEQLVSTGNLRSTAAARGTGQLLAQIQANAARRRLSAAQLILQGSQGTLQTTGGLAVSGEQLSTALTQQGLGFGESIAQGIVGKGRAKAAKITAIGASGDEFIADFNTNTSVAAQNFSTVASGAKAFGLV